MFKTIFKQFCQHFVENFRFTRICREIVDVAIYALYPESFCGVNLAIRKVFAVSDSGGSEGSKMLNLFFGKVFFQLACRIILGPPNTCFTLGLKLFGYISSFKNYFESVTV